MKFRFQWICYLPRGETLANCLLWFAFCEQGWRYTADIIHFAITWSCTDVRV